MSTLSNQEAQEREPEKQTAESTAPPSADATENEDGTPREGENEANAAVEKGEGPGRSPGGTDVPDGGLVAWLVVLGAWCTSFCSFGWLNSIGVFEEYYQTGPLSNYSSSTISWIPSLQIFFMFAMGPIVGRLFDKFGPFALLVVGTFLHVFGLMMASLATEYYQFLLAQGVCSAIGVSTVFQPGINSIPGWFNKNRGIAYGVLATGSSLGGIIFPIMLTNLISEVGYPWAMRISAFLILFLLCIAVLTIRTRTPPRPSSLTKAQMIQPFREPGFLLLLIGMCFLTFGVYVPITYIPVQAAAFGVDPNLVNYLVAILNAGSLFGRLASGFASDRVGKYNIFISCSCVTGVLILALWIPTTPDPTTGTLAFTVLFGFFSGAYVSLVGALVAQVSPLPEIGMRTGLVFLVSSIAGLLTDPIAGAIVGDNNNWVGLKVFGGVFYLVGTFAVLVARIIYAGPKPFTVF